MANEVYANGREIACKAASGKSIAAFPDVCFTPPMAPPTPPGVPIPYPNTGMAGDATSGSKKVKISGKEVMLKNKSYFKKAAGNEAGSATKKGIVTSTHHTPGTPSGSKAYFNVWSMDVKIETENAVRHMDLTTHNHASPLANTPPWMYVDGIHFVLYGDAICRDQEKEAEDKCAGATQRKKTTDKGNVVNDGLDCPPGCKEAKACVLKPKKDDKTFCCHADTTGHHLIEVHCFSPTGGRGKSLAGLESYRQNNAPCVCASEARDDGTHGVMHAVQGKIEQAYNDLPGPPRATWPGAGALDKATQTRGDAVSKWSYKDARDTGKLAHKTAFPHCNSKCTEKYLDDYHKKECGLDENTPLRSDPGAENRSSGTLDAEQTTAIDNAIDAVKGVTNSTSSV